MNSGGVSADATRENGEHRFCSLCHIRIEAPRGEQSGGTRGPKAGKEGEESRTKRIPRESVEKLIVPSSARREWSKGRISKNKNSEGCGTLICNSKEKKKGFVLKHSF